MRYILASIVEIETLEIKGDYLTMIQPILTIPSLQVELI